MEQKTKMLSEYPEVLRIKDLMQILSIGKNLAYKIVLDGTIKSKKIGREYFIHKKAVIQFLEELS